MIFRGIFRKFPENINKTLIAARPLSARDSCNVLCLFGFGVVDKKMFYTIRKVKKSESKSQPSLRCLHPINGCVYPVKLKNLKANHNIRERAPQK